jgi:hypothetical protein
MRIRDLFTIASRLGWLLDRRPFPATPLPWQRCHCGALADYRSVPDGGIWCWPCKYAGHETCECSDSATWGPDDFTSIPDPLGTVLPPAAAEGGAHPEGSGELQRTAVETRGASRSGEPVMDSGTEWRWRRALLRICRDGCSNGDAAFACPDLPLFRSGWCASCIAYVALYPPTSSPQPDPLRREAARPEPSRDGDLGGPGRATN